MLDPVALVETVRRSDAETLREMGMLFLELAERRAGNPDWDANMLLAVERVREQQAAGPLGQQSPPPRRVSVPVVRRTPAKAPRALRGPLPSTHNSSPDERNP